MRRWLPLVSLSLLGGVALVGRAWIQQRRWGHHGLILFRGDWGQNLRDAGLLLLAALLGLQALAAALSPERLESVALPLPPDGGALAWAGAAVVLAATGLLVAAQLELGASWRVGIDEAARPGLVTGGFYRHSRNPIFLFLLIALAGAVALLPTWISVLLFIGTVLGVRRQVRAEEAWLTRAYGEEYLTYGRRVGRFLPWLGKFRKSTGGSEA